MTAISNIVTIYVMMCIVTYALARISIHEKTLRRAFVVIGMSAPFFALYVLYKAMTTDEAITPEERLQIAQVDDEIERLRVSKFGGKSPMTAKIKVQYIRTLDKTAETIERMVDKLAA